MIECPSCGEDEELRGMALADGRRQITCERCGHSWTRGSATRATPSGVTQRSPRRSTATSCAPRWGDDEVVATLNREAPILRASGLDGTPLAPVPRREPTWTVGDPVLASRVFSYIVAHDSGFAPNPFHGLLTLACCKPGIRRSANVGDIVVGLSSKGERVVYAAQVADVISFEEYWTDPTYASRRPAMESARIIDRVGDNIYQPVSGGYRQLHSVHSKRNGPEDVGRKRTDLKGQHVLVCERFTYWGGAGPRLPDELRFLVVGRGYRANLTTGQVDTVARWFANLPGGVLGPPDEWRVGDQSWRET